MGEKTGIAWCHSTFNPWIGCSAVSVEKNGGGGCDNCYAKALVENRMGKDFATRWRTGTTNWNGPRRWNKQAAKLGTRWLVFCASLADVLDNEVPYEWRADLWALMRDTPNLTWLVLTKRIGNARSMIALAQGSGVQGQPLALPNVWLGSSVVNQAEADRDIPKLLATPAAKRFVSYEPALGPVEMTQWLGKVWYAGDPPHYGIDWVICGGESSQGGAKARPFVHRWGKDVVAQCRAAGVAVFVKQMGSNAVNREGERHPYKDRAGADPAEWPEDLRVQEFPV